MITCDHIIAYSITRVRVTLDESLTAPFETSRRLLSLGRTCTHLRSPCKLLLRPCWLRRMQALMWWSSLQLLKWVCYIWLINVVTTRLLVCRFTTILNKLYKCRDGFRLEVICNDGQLGTNFHQTCEQNEQNVKHWRSLNIGLCSTAKHICWSVLPTWNLRNFNNGICYQFS